MKLEFRIANVLKQKFLRQEMPLSDQSVSCPSPVPCRNYVTICKRYVTLRDSLSLRSCFFIEGKFEILWQFAGVAYPVPVLVVLLHQIVGHIDITHLPQKFCDVNVITQRKSRSF